jgi:hypothetical protein
LTDYLLALATLAAQIKLFLLAKASTVVNVACHCHWRYRAKLCQWK